MDKNTIETLRDLNRKLHEIKIKVEEGGYLPHKANKTDAGFDVFATSDIVIFPGQVVKHPLNIRFQLPPGTWAEVTSKSGLGAKGLMVYAGVIDEEYRGIVHVIMSNVNIIQGIDESGFPLMRTEPIVIKAGQKLAQFIMSPYNSSFYVTSVDQLDMGTARGEGGFGSTGV